MSGNKVTLAIFIVLQVILAVKSETIIQAGAFGTEATLTKQNQFRADHDASPLTKSTSLAFAAFRCAKKMVQDNDIPGLHPCNPGADKQGENIYTVPQNNAGANILEVAVQSWYNEVKNIDFTKSNWYMILDTNNAARPIGHFTQLVWKASESVGCGYAIGPTVTHIVCRYSPAGNQFTGNALKNNVAPPKQSGLSSCVDKDGCEYMQCTGSFKVMAEQMCPNKCGKC